jgi:hypothetical protein
MQNYVDDKNRMPKEQKGATDDQKGVKINHIFKATLQECKSRRKALCMAWTDYQKVSDSVPYSWIFKSLELIRINNKVVSFTKKSLNHWKASVHLYTE